MNYAITEWLEKNNRRYKIKKRNHWKISKLHFLYKGKYDKLIEDIEEECNIEVEKELAYLKQKIKSFRHGVIYGK